nr:MAG TPA: hypothetical protein [Caudoviricetes sp.]
MKVMESISHCFLTIHTDPFEVEEDKLYEFSS